MNAIILRPATTADLAAITAIYAHAVLHGTATYELTPPDEAEMTARFQALTGNRYPYLVAENDAGAFLGYAYAGPFRTRPAYNFMVENSIYLAEEAKGQGVGTRLLARLLEECERLGFRQMLAVIGGADNHASLRLHAKMGFEKTGMIPASGFKFGRWIDTVLMQRALGEGASTLVDDGEYPGPLHR